MTSVFTVPEGMTFEQAIALTQSLLAHMEQGTLPESEVERAIAALVSTEAGARGFFVTYLTDSGTLADHPDAPVLAALSSAPDLVAELLVKNLAMSSAMAVFHRRQQHETTAQESDRVRSRTHNLIRLLQLPAVQAKGQSLLDSITSGQGPYQSFLERWGYDAEQRQVIQQVLQQALT